MKITNLRDYTNFEVPNGNEFSRKQNQSKIEQLRDRGKSMEIEIFPSDCNEVWLKICWFVRYAQNYDYVKPLRKILKFTIDTALATFFNRSRFLEISCIETRLYRNASNTKREEVSVSGEGSTMERMIKLVIDGSPLPRRVQHGIRMWDTGVR